MTRQDLIAAGIVTPIEHVRPSTTGPVLRLDDAGRAAAVRDVEQGEHGHREMTRMPALENATPALEGFAEAIGDVTTWVVDNPKKAIGGAIAASIARAGIESLLRAKIEQAIMGRAGGAAVGGALGGAGAKGGVPAIVGGAPVAATAAAAVAAALAFDQADKLQTELGTKGSLGDVFQGFSGGKFSTDTMIEDMNPVARWRKLTGALMETAVKLHDEGEQDPTKKMGMQKGSRGLRGAIAQMGGADAGMAPLIQRLTSVERAIAEGASKTTSAVNQALGQELSVRVVNMPGAPPADGREPQ